MVIQNNKVYAAAVYSGIIQLLDILPEAGNCR
jgi:hypothetical protein